MKSQALVAGRKRQSVRTGFVHQEEMISIYENFCFALALLRQKTQEGVLEGRALIERLLGFRLGGNFPIYLHDYPKCYDPNLGLKIAPALRYALDFVLGDLKPKVEEALQDILASQPEKLIWQNRRRALLGQPLLDEEPTDWTEWLITQQLAGKTHFALPFDPNLNLFLPAAETQEKSEPAPHPIGYLLGAEGEHPTQIKLSLLFPITYDPVRYRTKTLFWRGTDQIHSLYPEEEVVYCNLSDETTVTVGGIKATNFKLGDTVHIDTPTKSFRVRFDLVQGEGDFVGQILRGNRPTQRSAAQYETYDWQIGIRTLRKSEDAKITLSLEPLH